MFLTTRLAGTIDSLQLPLHSDLGRVYVPVTFQKQALTFYFKVAKDLSQKTFVDHKPLGRVTPTFREIALKSLCLQSMKVYVESLSTFFRVKL